MAASPPVCAATAPAPDSLKSLRREMRAIFPPVVVVRGYLVAQITRAEELFANQENHDRSAQPGTPRRMAAREYAVSDQTAAAIWSWDVVTLPAAKQRCGRGADEAMSKYVVCCSARIGN